MTLTPHRKQKIYLAAMMGCEIGSDDAEEIIYFKKVKAEIKKAKKNVNIGFPRED